MREFIVGRIMIQLKGEIPGGREGNQRVLEPDKVRNRRLSSADGWDGLETIVDHAGIKVLTECDRCGEEKYIVEGETICEECKDRPKRKRAE